MSTAYCQRTRNPLLVKDDVGKAKPSCYRLPPEDFAYGRPDMPDFEGAREVTMQWVAHHAEARPTADVQDFKKLNKQAVREKVVDPKKLTQFRKERDVPIQPSSHAAPPPKVYPSEVVPSFTYGKKTRPSTPIAQVISNQFAAEYEASLAEIYDFYETEKQNAGKMSKIRTTRAAEGHARKLQEMELGASLEGSKKEPFKLSKFKNVKCKLVLPGGSTASRVPVQRMVQPMAESAPEA
jgi:hypothetical protein